jgi:hypothetical protein
VIYKITPDHHARRCDCLTLAVELRARWQPGSRTQQLLLYQSSPFTGWVVAIISSCYVSGYQDFSASFSWHPDLPCREWISQLSDPR